MKATGTGIFMASFSLVNIRLDLILYRNLLSRICACLLLQKIMGNTRSTKRIVKRHREQNHNQSEPISRHLSRPYKAFICLLICHLLFVYSCTIFTYIVNSICSIPSIPPSLTCVRLVTVFLIIAWLTIRYSITFIHQMDTCWVQPVITFEWRVIVACIWKYIICKRKLEKK